MTKIKLPALSKIKKALYADWALRVKKRDGFKCLLCGSEDNLTAHHWYVCDHHAHAARYCVSNGATLCYACHIRGVHQRADLVSVRAVAEAVMGSGDFEKDAIEICLNTELTVPVLRMLWDGMRARPIDPNLWDGEWENTPRGSKLFLFHKGRHPQAVAGNLLEFPAYKNLFEVATVAKVADGYRYTLKPLTAEVGEC